ncbi:MAG: M20 family metallo-hydrolase [Treponema sp.]|nr:M20 family metallo-hydrolase [Treponema sp.]MCL2236705.1 M20 family metallo-hydrolase [Treponema sp.]
MKEKLFSWLENSSDMAVELETELTKRPAVSPESDGEGEIDKCVFLEKWLHAHGITKLDRYDASDSRAKGGIRPNLVATINGTLGENEGCLWIMSHLDVVPPGEEKLWDNDPWTVVYKDDKPGARIIGRGVEDNQQGIVSSVLAALAFTEQGLKPLRTIKLLFASDEEVGSAYGIDWLVKNHPDLFGKNDMVLIPDGGDPDGEYIEVAEKTIIWAKFTVHGEQTHGSMPDLGNNAFLAGSDLAVKLHFGLSQKFNERDKMFDPDYSTFEPTKKEANVPNINTIPGEDVFYMDMRVLPRYSSDSILAEIDRIKAEVEKKYRVTIDCTLPQLMQSKPTDANAPIVKNIGKAITEVYGVNPRPVGIGGGTMAAYLRNIGIDCVVWTKTQKTLHQPNEYALLDNIIGDAKVMALLALNSDK